MYSRVEIGMGIGQCLERRQRGARRAVEEHATHVGAIRSGECIEILHAILVRS